VSAEDEQQYLIPFPSHAGRRLKCDARLVLKKTKVKSKVTLIKCNYLLISFDIKQCLPTNTVL
jgi:hypothetical protein